MFHIKTIKSKEVSRDLDLITSYTDGQLPHGILTEIAKKNNLSRERVRQIAMKKGLIAVRLNTKDRKFICKNCGEPFTGNKNKYTKKYCSDKCAKEYRNKTYFRTAICKQCGKNTKYLRSKRIPVFCSKTCQGKWLGLTSGKIAFYPKTLKLLKKDFPKDFTVLEFAKKYGYSSHYGAYIAVSDLRLRGKVIRISRGVYKII